MKAVFFPMKCIEFREIILCFAGGKYTMKRRRLKRYIRKRKNSGVQFLLVLGIIVIALLAGYFSARFVIAPVMGYDTKALNVSVHLPDGKLIKQKNTDEKDNESYALQFGAFSTEEAAKDLQRKLRDDGFETQVKLIDDKYKVLGELLDTKEAALKMLKDNTDNISEDVFVTTIKK